MKSSNGWIDKLVSLQDMFWDYIVTPIADIFRLDCEYCWWWRGVLFGSIVTSILISLVTWVIR